MPEDFHKINDSKDLVWKVEYELKQAIITKRYVSGQQLPGEIELALQFGVSRSVVREAIKSLKSSGFLEVRRGKGGGSYVTDFTRLYFKENFTTLIRLDQIKVDHLIKARLLIEPEVVKLAVENATDQDLQVIEQNLVEFNQSIKIDKQVSLNSLFHKLVGRSCGNPLYSVLMDKIMDFYEAYIRVIKPATQILTNVDDHAEIFNAIKRRDSKTAIEVTNRHITTTIERMIKMEATYLRLVDEQDQ